MIPLLPIALAAGGYFWWKKKHPEPVPAPQYQANDGKLYTSPFLVDGNLPANIAQQVVQMVNNDTDISDLAANQAWLSSSGYPISAGLLGDKINRIKAAGNTTHVASGSIWR